MRSVSALLIAVIGTAGCSEDPGVEATPDAAVLLDASVPDAGIELDGGGRAAEHLWGLDHLAPAIVRVRLSDLEREVIVPFEGGCGAECPVFEVEPDQGWIFYTKLDLSTLVRRPIDGGPEETLWTASGKIRTIDAPPREDAVYLVVDDPAAGLSAVRYDLATGEAQTIIERASLPFAADPERGFAWQLENGVLTRIRLDDGTVTRAFGGPFLRVSEFALDRGSGSITYTTEGARSIDRLDREARSAGTVIADAQGEALAFLDPAIDPESQRLAWLKIDDPEALPEVVLAEPGAAPRVLSVPFMFNLRFDGVEDRAAPEPAEPSAAPRPAGSIPFAPCPGAPRLECAELVVPIDPADPTGEKTTLPVRRRRALREDLRRGVIVFDYGGPGFSFVEQFEKQAEDDGLAGSGVSLIDRFDLVALERRGIAPATPRFACAPETPFLPRPLAAADWDRIETWWAAARTDCAGHPLIDHMSSKDVAADFEALRLALGEAQLTFVTWSYGTTTGATYATAYPSSVRAMALISPTRPVQTSDDRVRTRTALEDRAFFDFFEWCAAEPGFCLLGQGASSALEVKLRFDELLDDLQLVPIRINNILHGDEAVLAYLTANHWFAARWWKTDGHALGAAYNGDRGPLTEALRRRQLGGDPVSGDWSDTGSLELSVFLGAHGLDRPFPAGFDDAAARALGEEMATFEYAGPRGAVQTGILVGWPAAAPPGLRIGPTSAPPLLVSVSRFDYATIFEHGQELIDLLDNGSQLLTYEGHLHSAAGVDHCTGSAITDYLLDPSRAPSVTSCAETPVAYWP